MITKAMIGWLKLMPVIYQNNASVGAFECKNVNGVTKSIAARSYNAYPATIHYNVNAQSSGGICLGSGRTSASHDDYSLESPISTSKFSASTPSVSQVIDSNGNLSIVFTFTITNISNEDLTIGEIGYSQKLNVSGTQNDLFLLDRTVLETPITIAPQGYAAIKYTLKSIF